MQIGMIGLGRMGGNISRRLMKAGHHCVVFDANAKPREALAKEGATAVQSLADLVKALKEKPRADLGDVARRPDHRRDGRASRRPAGAGRHHHRWRQFLLQGRHPPRQETGREAHSLRRLRHLRRRLGHRARLLHDDRRPEGRPSITSIRSSRRSLPGWAISRARRAARKAIPAPSAATFTPARPAPGTSSRWCTTASSTD